MLFLSVFYLFFLQTLVKDLLDDLVDLFADELILSLVIHHDGQGLPSTPALKKTTEKKLANGCAISKMILWNP